MSEKGGSSEPPEILVPVIMIHPPQEEEKVKKTSIISKKNLPPIVSKSHPVHGKESNNIIEDTITTPARKYIDSKKYSEAVDVLQSLLPENESNFETSVEIYHLLLKCYNCLNEVEKQIVASFDFFLKFSNDIMMKTFPPEFFEFLKWVKSQRTSVLSSIFPPNPSFSEDKQNLINRMFEYGQVKSGKLVNQFSKYASKPIDFARNLIRKRKSKEKNDPEGMKVLGRLFGCMYRSLKGMSGKFAIVRSLIEIECIDLILKNGLLKTGEKDEEGVSGMMLIRFAANTFPHFFEWDGCSTSVQILAKSSIRINSCDVISCEKYFYFYQLLPLLKGKVFSNIFPMTTEGFRLSLSDPSNPNYTYARAHGISFYMWKYLMTGKSWKFFDEQMEFLKQEDPLFNEMMNLLVRLDDALRGEQRITRWEPYDFINPELNEEIKYYGRFLLPFVKAIYLCLSSGKAIDAGESLTDAGRYVGDGNFLEEIHYRFFQGILAGRNLEELNLSDPKQSEELMIEKDRLEEALEYFTKLEKCNVSFFLPFLQFVQVESKRWDNFEELDEDSKSRMGFVDEISSEYLSTATSFQKSGHLLFVALVLERRLKFVWKEGSSVEDFEVCLKNCVKAWSDMKASLARKRIFRKYGKPSSKMLQRIEKENNENEDEEGDEEEEEIQREFKTAKDVKKVEMEKGTILTPRDIEDKKRASDVIGKLFDQLKSPTSPVDENKKFGVIKTPPRKPVLKINTGVGKKKKKKKIEHELSTPKRFVPPTPLSIGGRGMLDDDSIFEVVESKKPEKEVEEEETVIVRKIEEEIEVSSRPVVVVVEESHRKSEKTEGRGEVGWKTDSRSSSPPKRDIRLPKQDDTISRISSRTSLSQQRSTNQQQQYGTSSSTMGGGGGKKNRTTANFLGKFLPFGSASKPSESEEGHPKFVNDLQKTLLEACFSRYEFLSKQLGVQGYVFPKFIVSQIVEERNRTILKIQRQQVQKYGMVKRIVIPLPSFKIRKIGKFLVQDRIIHNDIDDEEEEGEEEESDSILNSNMVFNDPELQRKKMMKMKKKKIQRRRKKMKNSGYKTHELYEVFDPKMYRQEVLTIYDRMHRLFLKKRFVKVMKVYMEKFTMNDHLHPKDRKSKTQRIGYSTTHRTKLHEGSSILQKTMFYIGKARRGLTHFNEKVDRKTMMDWKGEQVCRYLYVVAKLFRHCQLPGVWKGEIPVGWDGRPKMFGHARPSSVQKGKIPHSEGGGRSGGSDLKSESVASAVGSKPSSLVVGEKGSMRNTPPRKSLINDDDDDVFFANLEKEKDKKKRLSFLNFETNSPVSEAGGEDKMVDMYNRLNHGLSKKPISPAELSPSLGETKRKLLEEKEQKKLAMQLQERMEKEEKENKENVGVKVKKLISGVEKVKGGISSWIQKKKDKKKMVDPPTQTGPIVEENEEKKKKKKKEKKKKEGGGGGLFKRFFSSGGSQKKDKKKKKEAVVVGGKLYPPKKKRRKRISQLEMRRRTYQSPPPMFGRGRNKVVPASSVPKATGSDRNVSFLTELRKKKKNKVDSGKSTFKEFLEQRDKKRKAEKKSRNILDIVEKKN